MWLAKFAVALCCLISMMATPSRAEEPILIRFSHVVGENTPKGLGAQLYKKRVEERLAGKVVVEIYPRSQKFNDDEVFLALLFGDVEMAAPSLSKFRSYAPVLQVYDLPFLFRDVDHVHRFQKSVVGRQLLETVLPVGIMGLAYWDNGMRAISANKPLHVPADAEGLVFRIEASMVFQQQWARVGVVGIPMPFSSVTDAIREGLVQGQENSWSNIFSRKIQELQKNITELNHNFQGYMVITNQEFWENLPNDVRPVLEEILAEVTAEVDRIALEQAESTRRSIAEVEGVEIFTPSTEELAMWREAFTPVWKQFEPEIGKEVIDAVVETGGAN